MTMHYEIVVILFSFMEGYRFKFHYRHVLFPFFLFFFSFEKFVQSIPDFYDFQQIHIQIFKKEFLIFKYLFPFAYFIFLHYFVNFCLNFLIFRKVKSTNTLYIYGYYHKTSQRLIFSVLNVRMFNFFAFSSLFQHFIVENVLPYIYHEFHR